MQLLAQYVRTPSIGVLDIQLVDIETGALMHYITDQEADDAGTALIHAARAWAKANGHEVADIDSTLLNAA